MKKHSKEKILIVQVVFSNGFPSAPAQSWLFLIPFRRRVGETVRGWFSNAKVEQSHLFSKGKVEGSMLCEVCDVGSMMAAWRSFCNLFLGHLYLF